MQLTNDATWWGNIETAAIAAFTGIATFVGFLGRLAWRVGQLKGDLARQREDFERSEAQTADALKELAAIIEKLRQGHHDLHSQIIVQPTRVDLREVEGRIRDQLDHLSGQVDRLVESRLWSRPPEAPAPPART